MKTIRFLIVWLLFPLAVFSQSQFNLQDYQDFLQSNQDLEFSQLLSRHQPPAPYFSGTTQETNFSDFAYLDSIKIKLGLTKDEWQRLQKFHFVVTERLSSGSFGGAFHKVYSNDLPVFISTDAILEALHRSYDTILIQLELGILQPRLIELTQALYDDFPQLSSKYAGNATLDTALSDVDLYVTIAQSLMKGALQSPHLQISQKVNEVWQAIQNEQYAKMTLFSDRERAFDFSQFKVRGHYAEKIFYNYQFVSLKDYFKTMMWLGRIELLLTPPPKNPWEPPWTFAEIRRMDLGASLLNELLQLSNAQENLNTIDTVLQFWIGESDNLTPEEFSQILSQQHIARSTDLLNPDNYDSLQHALLAAPFAKQKILSSILMVDPCSAQPDTLPVSYRLLGQRFVVDSYILGNLVYDHIIFQGNKIYRPLPDPLDALFVLGNDDALPLLKNEMEIYHYAAQAADLRYLLNAYDPNFWNASLYNTWLQAIRELNPQENSGFLPYFMKTTAWHQEKLNTQLASWAQLRHDNLLYAKQSYTGASGCSFPHSFIEPYPEFYRQVGRFANKATMFFSTFDSQNFPQKDRIVGYFGRLKEISDTLTVLSEKELERQPFDDAEKIFLKKMLFESMVSGAPPYTGWYADLFFNPVDAALEDYIIADVHTQPTDYDGNPVGRILHVSVGKVNLGVFLASAPTADFKPMAFVGPTFSFYQKITINFNRLTDQAWSDSVKTGNLPPRPDWVNLYLTDSDGKALAPGRELPGVLYTRVGDHSNVLPQKFALFQNYPNPFNPVTTIEFQLPQKSHVTLAVFDVTGRKVAVLVDAVKQAGAYSVQWNASSVPSGVYFCRIHTNGFEAVRKLVLLR